MKATKFSLTFTILLLLALFESNCTYAQGSVPAEVESIVTMNLEQGQERLSSLGYEICSSSFVGKKQDWYNESTKTCVTIKFDKKSKEITEVLLNPDITACQKGLEAGRKVWENYHDGQAPVQAQKIDDERKKLSGQGYQVSYWINDVSPGRSAECWINETTQKAVMIVWEMQGNAWVMTNPIDYERGKNPAPKKQ